MTFKMISLLLVCFFFVNGQSVDPTTVRPPPKGQCPAIMKSAGASEHFGFNIGHATHSITVENLKVFEPAVTANNVIPTVNRYLDSYDAILAYAPDIKSRKSVFKTKTLLILDDLFSKWDKNYMNSNNGQRMVEKIVHEFHMREMYAAAEEPYAVLKNSSAVSTKTCECVLDVQSNGVMAKLWHVALQIREPALAFGTPPRKYRKFDEGDDTKGPGPNAISRMYYKWANKQKEFDPSRRLDEGAAVTAKQSRPYYLWANKQQEFDASRRFEEGEVANSPNVMAKESRPYYFWANKQQEFDANVMAKESRPYYLWANKQQEFDASAGGSQKPIANLPYYKWYGKQQERQTEFDASNGANPNDKPKEAWQGYYHWLTNTKIDRQGTPLTDAASWEKWREWRMDPGLVQDLALYLYCALKNVA